MLQGLHFEVGVMDAGRHVVRGLISKVGPRIRMTKLYFLFDAMSRLGQRLLQQTLFQNKSNSQVLWMLGATRNFRLSMSTQSLRPVKPLIAIVGATGTGKSDVRTRNMRLNLRALL
jgi:hypothetical protein